MFNAFFIPQGFFMVLGGFWSLFIIRWVFISRLIFVFLYYVCLFCVLFVASFGGGDVQNDGYNRLEKFILLEKNNQLAEAQKKPESFD